MRKGGLSKLRIFKFFSRLSKNYTRFPELESPLILKDSFAIYLVLFALASFAFAEPQQGSAPRVEALTHPIVSIASSYAENLETISLPQASFIDVGPVTLPSLPADAPKLSQTAAAANSNAAQTISTTLS